MVNAKSSCIGNGMHSFALLLAILYDAKLQLLGIYL
jgi:hypothetical protein